MFSTKRIKISRELFEQLTERAEQIGYSSVDEFIAHVLEKQVSDSGADEDQAREQLKGLGYIE